MKKQMKKMNCSKKIKKINTIYEKNNIFFMNFKLYQSLTFNRNFLSDHIFQVVIF